MWSIKPGDQRLMNCISGDSCLPYAVRLKHFYASKRLQPFGRNAIPKRSAGFTEKRRKENKGVNDASDVIFGSPPVAIRRSLAKFGEV